MMIGIYSAAKKPPHCTPLPNSLGARRSLKITVSIRSSIFASYFALAKGKKFTIKNEKKKHYRYIIIYRPM